LIAKLNAFPEMFLAASSSNSNEDDALQSNAGASWPSTRRLSPKSHYWNIELEVAGIVLRFSKVSTFFLKMSRC